MKSKIILVLSFLCVLTALSGCTMNGNSISGGEISGKNSSGSDSFAAAHEDVLEFYDKPERVLDSVYAVLLHDHYCYGYVSSDDNKWARNFTQYNEQAPLFYIYVYPNANEEVIEQTADALYYTDLLFADNNGYRKYCRKNGVPYFVELKCFEESFAKIELTGKHTYEDILSTISEGVSRVSETVMAPLYDFYGNLDRIDGLSKDENGNYYFIVDSHNFDESSTAIVNKVKQVAMIDPLPADVWETYADSQAVLGYLDKGFTVYADSIAPENEIFTQNFNADPKYFPIWMFLHITGQGYNLDAERKVKLGSVPDDVDARHFYTSFQSEADGKIRSTISLGGELEGPYTRDTIVGYTVDYLNDLRDVLNEHKIKDTIVVSIYMSFPIEEDLWVDGSFDVPMDEPFTVEMMNALIDENGNEYHPSEYELGDDCIE